MIFDQAAFVHLRDEVVNGGKEAPSPSLSTSENGTSCIAQSISAGLGKSVCPATAASHKSFTQPTPSQISNRETVITDMPVETMTADDIVSTCTLYC